MAPGINDQLANKGLKVNEARGAIIDMTIVESAARRRTRASASTAAQRRS